MQYEENGWVKLHRNLLNDPIFINSTPQQAKILIVILLLANHKAKKWDWNGKKFSCESGQFVTSIEKLVLNCGKGITTQNVRAALKRFEKLEFLTNKSTKQGRLITILNWGFYQEILDNPTNKPTKTQQTPNKDSTNTQQTPNKHPTTNKKEKNDKNDKKERNKNNMSGVETPNSQIVISLTLNDKSEYEIQEKQVGEWKELYPCVDIMQDLRNMKGWLTANPTKRKTRAGILRFITAWLARTQDKGGNKHDTSGNDKDRSKLYGDII